MLKYLMILAVSASLIAEESQTLKVPGSGKAFVTSSIADIRLSVHTSGTSAQDVQKKLSTQAAPAITFLKNAKVQNLQTENMQIYAEYSKNTPPEVVGYKGQMDLTFSTSIENAGRLIDSAISNGANEVQSITYRPSDEDAKEGKLLALREACENALAQASAVMKALKLKKNSISNVEIEGGQVQYPMPRVFNAMKDASTEVLAGEQKITANVNVVIVYSPEG